MTTTASHILTVVDDQFRHHFTREDHFILAISGGADSMALLAICHQLIPNRFLVVTIDHGLRSDSSLDTQMVAHFCKQKGIECVVEHFDLPTVAKNQNLEAVARSHRYQILEQYRQQHKAAAIITAHHHQDQLETQLMHLARGCAILGLVGMVALNTQKIFRPLLAFEKTELLSYARAHSIPWREDSTNTDQTYQRNRFRHHVLPLLTTTELDQLHDQAQQVEIITKELVHNWLSNNLQANCEHQYFALSTWLSQPLFVQLAALYHFLTIQLGKEDISATAIGHAHQWCLKARKGSTFSHQGQAVFFHEKTRIRILHSVEIQRA
jgi:tRNA(Ile)-lysidine synthetase-like protein